jgi:hypothetical protein
MLRRAYVWILRLHPRSFRKDFADEMLLIFDELAASAARPRLAEIKLLGDGIVSFIRQRALRPEFQRTAAVAAPTPPLSDGVPVFYVIGSFKPRPTALAQGLILSIAVLGAALLAIRFSWNHTVHLPFPALDLEETASAPEQQLTIIPTEIASAPIAKQLPPKNGEVEGAARPQRVPASGKTPGLQVEPAPKQGKDDADYASAASRQPVMAATRIGSVNDKPAGFQSKSLPMNHAGFRPQTEETKSRDASSATNRAPAEDFRLDAAERQRVIDRATASLRQHYFDRDVAQKTALALLAHEKNGDDNAVTEGGVFADLLTRQMRDASHDMHLVMEYSQARLPDHPLEQTSESLARYRKAMEQENCGFKKIKILPHNIGYLKLNSFPDISVCQATASTAMASLNHADAIIFDLRDNTGGMENMVALIAGYLFDHPEYMYSPRANPTEQSWTRSPVEGNRLADKPVYVLTSASTWSGAEQFCYDLKMLKRATLVGERTRGGAHAGVFHRIDDHFGMGIPEVKPINPYGKADWEGTGVEPDVKVKAADALEVAQKLAESDLQKKN